RYDTTLSHVSIAIHFLFFFQAEDGIRDRNVTGVQTCALPIWKKPARTPDGKMSLRDHLRELRNRLFKAGIGILLGTIVGFIVYRSEERRVGKECRSRWWSDQ